MTPKEQRVWQFVLANRKATIDEIADACEVSRDFAAILLSRIGTPEAVWRNEDSSALTRQEGGSHYKTMTVQPWEAVEAWLTPEEYRGYHKATAIGYLARERQKGGDEDIRKAVHHLQRLLEVLDEQRRS